MDIKLKDDEVLVLVTENPTHEENKLPTSGLVVRNEPMSGLLWGYGDYMGIHSYCNIIDILVKVSKKDLIDESGEVKFSRGEVIYSGDWSGAFAILKPYWLSGIPEGIKFSSTLGDNCPSYTHDDLSCSYTTGDNADSITKGNSAHSITTGWGSHAITSGHNSFSLTYGHEANSVANGNMVQCITKGVKSAACAIGSNSKAHTKGDLSPGISISHNIARGYSITEGNDSPSISVGVNHGGISQTFGERSHSIILGYSASASAVGANSIACALDQGSEAKSGEQGAIILTWTDKETGKIRIKVGYPGEDGIKPDTYYRLDEDGNFIESEYEFDQWHI